MSAWSDWFEENYRNRDRGQTLGNMEEAFEAGLEAGKSEHDSLRKAIKQYLDCQTTNQWVTHFLKALKGG